MFCKATNLFIVSKVFQGLFSALPLFNTKICYFNITNHLILYLTMNLQSLDSIKFTWTSISSKKIPADLKAGILSVIILFARIIVASYASLSFFLFFGK